MGGSKVYPQPVSIDERNLGSFLTVAELEAQYPVANFGDSAFVAETNTKWIWSDTSNTWVNSLISGETLPATTAPGDFLIGNGSTWLVRTLTQVKSILGLVFGTTSGTYAEGSVLQAHKNDTSNPHSTTKAQVGLGNVDNTSDLNKPISTATQAELDKKQEHLGVGLTSFPTVTDNGDGTLTIGSAYGNLYDNVSSEGVIINYTIQGATLTFTEGVEEYVGAKYNSGAPVFYKETDKYAMNGSNSFLYMVVWRQGLILHTSDQGLLGLGLSNKLNSRLLLTEPYKLSLDGGLVIAETIIPANRTILVTSGVIFKGTVAENVLPFDSSEDLLTKAVYTLSGWTYSSASVYDNTHINPYAGGESSMTGNKWKYNLYYRSIGDIKEVFYIQSPEEYTSEAAARTASEAGRTDLPTLIKNHCLLIGRSIIQNNASTGITEPFVSRTGFFTSPIPNHNDTNNIQGGIIEERYHLTAQQHNEKIVNMQFGDVNGGNYSEFEADGTIVSKGNAITYRDELSSYVGAVSGAAAPDLTTHTIGGVQRYLYSFDGANTQEILNGSFEIPHDYAYGQPIEIHIHWRPSTTGTGAVQWFFDWEHSPAQAAPIAQTSLNVIHTISTNNQYWHLLTTFGNLPNLDFKLGDKIGFNLRRTPNGAGDTYAADALFEQIALHIPCDTNGSRQIYLK